MGARGRGAFSRCPGGGGRLFDTRGKTFQYNIGQFMEC